MYKPPLNITPTTTPPKKKLLMQKNPPLNRPPGGLVLGNCPQIQSKPKKSGKFRSKNKANPLDF